MRKLASIQKIKDIQPIPKADKIEVATVNDWNVVIRKGEYKVGELVVYCEIDSFLPIRDEFEFLRKSSYKKMTNGDEGFRLKTIKLRGQVSNGLLLKLDLVPEDVLFDLVDETQENHDYLIGTDVTEALNITKYEPPIPAQLAGQMKGYFPSWIRKTDQERVQNLSDEYDELKEKQWFITEKLDGSSATFYLKDGEFGVCSRNIDLLETEDNTFWKVARELEIEEKMRKYSGDNILNLENFAIQGELIGEGIQGNRYNIKGQTVKFFNVFDIDNYTSLPYQDFYRVFLKMKLDTVPIYWNSVKLTSTIKALIEMAYRKSELNSDVIQEGFVMVNTFDGNESFKVISNEFLLEEK